MVKEYHIGKKKPGYTEIGPERLMFSEIGNWVSLSEKAYEIPKYRGLGLRLDSLILELDS